jgi:gas vesicle protein
MEESNGYYGAAAGWFLFGSLVGACTGLLLAPATGKRTRERLARKLRDTRESVSDFTDDLAEKTREVAEQAGRIGDKAVRLAGDASAAARDVIGSLGPHTAKRTGTS